MAAGEEDDVYECWYTYLLGSYVKGEEDAGLQCVDFERKLC